MQKKSAVCRGSDAFFFFRVFCLTFLTILNTAPLHWVSVPSVAGVMVSIHRCLPSNGSGFNFPGDAFYQTRTNRTTGVGKTLKESSGSKPDVQTQLLESEGGNSFFLWVGKRQNVLRGLEPESSG